MTTGELETRLRREVEGEVMFDAFSRGRYATDASIYQIMPRGVVVPKRPFDVEVTLAIARELGIPVLPRGGGTSQCGQTVNDALVIDVSRHLNGMVGLDLGNLSVEVEPGVVLDNLNHKLKRHGLWFPVDVSTSSRATIGGMTANNSCGSRSIRFGTMRDNVLAVDALLADGSKTRFGEIDRGLSGIDLSPADTGLFRELLDLGVREADEIQARFPDLMRRVGGYNIDALVPSGASNNLAHLLVGSEGTLAYSERVSLKLSPLPRHKLLGVCHFPSFYQAMDAAQHLVTLDPTAVELMDRTMLELSRDSAVFRPVVDRFVRGEPDALLLVEFAENSPKENRTRLTALGEMMAELGFRWGDAGKQDGGVVEAVEPEFQKQVWEVRKQGLNIMMSMKSEGKPVSFVEDCAVRLEDLAEYTRRLTEIFDKYGTSGTWYAHASVGTLHVRPVLNLKLDTDTRAMRAIAEEAFEMVREYQGSHSGEHGDGICRSEFHRDMFGDRMVRNFEWVKDRLDPSGLFNPGKIVRAPKMDDRTLLRYGPGYKVPELSTVFDWSAHPGAGGGFQGAVEMCNNNGACRKTLDGAMCPSYRVTRKERDLVRGRANTLRLAISGQLGPEAFTSAEMAETLSLCVSCKACRRECPTGVDMAKMKIEVQAGRVDRYGMTLRDRLIAFLPHYAPTLSRVRWIANSRDTVPAFRALSERFLGLSRARALPRWLQPWHSLGDGNIGIDDADVVLFADTFNRYFEPENLRATETVLRRAGLTVAPGTAPSGNRPLCCGRTFLTAGLIDRAKAEMRRTLQAVVPALERGVCLVGIEPSCMLTFRDEVPALLGKEWNSHWSDQVLLLEEFVARKSAEGQFDLPLAPLDASKVLVHGHCHQKAFNVMGSVERTLALIPGLDVEQIASSCCGMAGAFGYQAETVEVSRAMAELTLLPTIRRAPRHSIVVADGTSCRQQIAFGSRRRAVHVARVLCEASDLALG